jgi:septal ring factor EnvC (AmiA/AmiB activator)
MRKMRSYPLLFIIVAFSLIIAADVLSSEEDNKESRIKSIEKDLSHEKEQYLQFNQKEKGLLDQLSDIEKEVNEKKIVIKNLGETLQSAQVELKRQREVLKGTEASFGSMKLELNKRLVAFYKYAERSYLKIFTSSNDLIQLNHMTKYLKVILDKDLSTIRKASREQQTYKQQVALVERQLKTISSMEQEESSKVLSLKADLDRKVILLTQIHREKEFYETAVKELGSAAENLKDTIRTLDYREEHVAEKSSSMLPSGFADLKGKLPFPMKGKIVKDARGSGNNILSAHKGVYLDGVFGDDVKSVYQGRVDYSGQLKGYGQVVVINHGSRYFTVSAYLSHRNKAEGDMVQKGEIIGQVGETGLATGSGLYFEIRKGDSILDPLKWLKVN